MVQLPTTTLMMKTNSSSLNLLDSNTIFILATGGTLLMVVMVTAIIIGIACVYKSRRRKEKLEPLGVNLKRTNTTRSSNSSDFVFSSPYEWTCRQTRLLSHLRPDTTGYQSHWSLTRDIKKQRSAIDIDHKEPHTQTNTVQTTAQNSLGTTGEPLKCSPLNQRDCMRGGGTAVERAACVVIENRFPHTRSSDFIDSTSIKVEPVHENSTKSTQSDDLTTDETDNFSERIDQTSSKKVPGIIQPSSTYHESTRTEPVAMCSMYHNPIYVKKMDSRRENEIKNKEKQGDDDLCSISSYAAPTSFFLLPDNEAYDSGNASAVSTDIAPATISTAPATISTAPVATTTDTHGAYHNRHTSTSVGTADGSKGVVESSSFEFSNNSGFEYTAS